MAEVQEELLIVAKMRDKLTPEIKRVEGRIRTFRMKAGAAFKALGAAARTLGRAFKAMLGPLTILTAAFSAMQVGLGLSMSRAAADAEELGSKFDALFGQAAASAREWAETYRRSVGRGTQDTLTALADMRGFTEGLGLASEEADQLAFKLVEMGNDLSSFYNVGAEDAFMRLRSGLIGNAEALDAFAARISESQLKEYATEQGILYNELSDTERVLLRLEVLQQKVNKAMGDAARTSGSFQNQMRALSGILRDVQSQFGRLVNKYILDAIEQIGGPGKLNDLIEIAAAVTAELAQAAFEVGSEVVIAFSEMVDAVGGVEAAISKVSLAWERLKLTLLEVRLTASETIRVLTEVASLGMATDPGLELQNRMTRAYIDSQRKRINELEAMLASALGSDGGASGFGAPMSVGTMSIQPAAPATSSDPAGPGGGGIFGPIAVASIKNAAAAAVEYAKSIELAQTRAMRFGAANSITNAFTSMATGAKTASDAVKDLIASLAQLIIRQKIASVVFPAFGIEPFANGGIAKGGFGGAMPVHGYANGGRVFKEPHLAVIGEGRYNEAAVPLPDGRRIPVDLRGAGGGGSTTSVSFNVTAMDARGVEELFAENGRALAQVIAAQFQRNRTFKAVMTGAVT